MPLHHPPLLPSSDLEVSLEDFEATDGTLITKVVVQAPDGESVRSTLQGTSPL